LARLPGWDADSPQLNQNLEDTLSLAQQEAESREKPNARMAQTWQRQIMHGLDVPRPEHVGRFRGSRGLEFIGVRIGSATGVAPEEVAKQLVAFSRNLQKVVKALDDVIEPGARPANADELQAVVSFAAWVHSEWVRIHPFANGNGRTARLWANYIFMRYGLPPVIQLRPRPDDGYERASAAAMGGDSAPTARVFMTVLSGALKP